MWYIYTTQCYSAIERNEIGSFVEMWMDLETVVQSEVSQKEKNKYHMLTHIYGILKKNGAEEPRGRTGIKTQNIENGPEDMGSGKGKLGRRERVAWTYIHYEM